MKQIEQEKTQFNTYPLKTELEIIKKAAKSTKQSASDFMVLASLQRAKLVDAVDELEIKANNNE